MRGQAPATPYYSPRRGGLRLTRARRPQRAPACRPRTQRTQDGASDAARSTSRSTAASCGRRRCSCSGRCSCSRSRSARPGPFPASTLPPSFDGAVGDGARRPSSRRDYPDRAARARQAPTGAAAWVKEKLGLYGLAAAEDAWDETIPGSAASACATSSPSFPARRPTRSSSSRTATTRASGPARTTTPPAPLR